MTDHMPDGWAERLTQTARALPYPPTPNLAAGRRGRLARPLAPKAQRRWQLVALALAGLAVLVLGLLTVPAVRAEVAKFIQIGVVRIFVGPATPTPTVAATAPLGTTPTPRPTATVLPSLLDSLDGETTLVEARRRAGFTVGLPAYPPDLGAPDRVFLQTDGAPMVVLVWLDLAQPGRARLALFEIAPGNLGIEKSGFIKGVPLDLQSATVHGQPAAWTTGPYLVALKNGDRDFTRLIDGHVLIWLDNGLTYRLELENEATVAEAVQIAESLQ